MKKDLNKLIKQAKEKTKYLPKEKYDFSKLTTEELKEIANCNPTDERIEELLLKAR